jgi:hypothetical protein
MAEDHDEYISGEQHHALHSSKKPASNFTITKPVAALIAAVVLAGLSFYGGIQYQKDRHPTTTTTATSSNIPGTLLPRSGSFGGGRGSGRLSGQRPTFGSVTAISAASITVDSNSGTSMTFAITSSTVITDNGQTTTTSDITTSDTVAVIASSTDTTQAARILVNPGFGGGSSSTSTQSNSPTPTIND